MIYDTYGPETRDASGRILWLERRKRTRAGTPGSARDSQVQPGTAGEPTPVPCSRYPPTCVPTHLPTPGTYTRPPTDVPVSGTVYTLTEQ